MGKKVEPEVIALPTRASPTKDAPPAAPSLNSTVIGTFFKGHNLGGSHWVFCAAILFNGTVGGGLLNVPASVIAAGGFAYGFAIIIVFAFFGFLGNMLIIWCSDLKKTTSYQSTVRVALGKPGELVSAFFVFFLMFFSTCYIFIGLSDMIQRVIVDSVGSELYCNNWYLQRTFLAAIDMVVVILPCCLVMHIDKLKYVSSVAVVAIFSVIFVTIYEFFDNPTVRYNVPEGPIVWVDVFLGIPGIAIGFSNLYATVNVYSRQAPRSQRLYARAVALAIGVSAACYIGTAYFADELFGVLVADDFTKSFKSRNWVVRVAFLAYIVKLSFEIPVMQFVGWTSVETFISAYFEHQASKTGKTHVEGAGSPKWLRVRRIVISLVWLSAVFLITTFANTLSYISGLLSAFVLVIFAAIPGACGLRGLILYPSRAAGWEGWIKGGSVLLLGTAGFLIGVVLTQYERLLAHMHTDFSHHSCLDQ